MPFRPLPGSIYNAQGETEEQYNERIKRTNSTLQNFRNQMSKTESFMEIEKPKKPILKKVKKVAKCTLFGLAGISLLAAGYYGTIKLASWDAVRQVEGNLHIKNDGYEKWKNIPAGYYNDHPLKICISNNFNGFDQTAMKIAMNYLDGELYGAKFDVVVDDVKTTDADVIVKNYPVDISYEELCNTYDNFEEEGAKFAGCTVVLPDDTDKIYGDIIMNSKAFHNFTMGETLIHESLHLIAGLKHSDDINSIMYPCSCSLGLSEQDKINANTKLPAKEEVEEVESVNQPKLVSYVTTENDKPYSYAEYFKYVKEQRLEKQATANVEAEEIEM